MADDGSRVDFTKSAADRIAKVVRLVEKGSRDQVGPHYSRVWEESSQGTSLRLGTYTGSWSIASSKVVTLVGSTSTFAVKNFCIPANANTSNSGTYSVIFGSVSGTMSAVEIQLPTATCTTVIGGFDLTTLPNYKSGVIQILGHGANNTNSTACFGLQWIDTTACST